MRRGDKCRARCGAPARFAGFGMCCYVSALDNEIAVDRVDPSGTASDTLPHPSDRCVRIVHAALAASDRFANPF
jgi:hypothetical protein